MIHKLVEYGLYDKVSDFDTNSFYIFQVLKVSYKYNTYHILDHSEEALLSMNNPFALIVLAAQKALLRGRIPEEELGEQRLTVARALIKSQKYSHEQIMHFLYFLKNFIYIENPEINSNFDREIELLTGKENAMGIMETIKKITREEAREEGRKEGFVSTAENLLKRGMSIQEVSEITTLSIEEVTKIAEKIE